MSPFMPMLPLLPEKPRSQSQAREEGKPGHQVPLIPGPTYLVPLKDMAGTPETAINSSEMDETTWPG